jgi:hypothetical protein
VSSALAEGGDRLASALGEAQGGNDAEGAPAACLVGEAAQLRDRVRLDPVLLDLGRERQAGAVAAVDVADALQPLGARAHLVDLDLEVGVVRAQKAEDDPLEGRTGRLAALARHVEAFEQQAEQGRIDGDRGRVECLARQHFEDVAGHPFPQGVELLPREGRESVQPGHVVNPRLGRVRGAARIVEPRVLRPEERLGFVVVGAQALGLTAWQGDDERVRALALRRDRLLRVAQQDVLEAPGLEGGNVQLAEQVDEGDQQPSRESPVGEASSEVRE